MKYRNITALCLAALLLCSCQKTPTGETTTTAVPSTPLAVATTSTPESSTTSVSATTTEVPDTTTEVPATTTTVTAATTTVKVVPATSAVEPPVAEPKAPLIEITYTEPADIEEIVQRKLTPDHAFIRQAALFGTVESFAFSPDEHLYTYTIRSGAREFQLTVDRQSFVPSWINGKKGLSMSKENDLRHHGTETGIVRMTYLPEGQVRYEELHYIYEAGNLTGIAWYSDRAHYLLEWVSPLGDDAPTGDLVSGLMFADTAMDTKIEYFPRARAIADRDVTDAISMSIIDPDETELPKMLNSDLPQQEGAYRRPLFRLQSREELLAFTSQYAGVLDYSKSGRNMPIKDMESRYDAAFLAEYTLFGIICQSATTSGQYGVEYIEVDGEHMTLHITDLADLGGGNAISFQLLIVPVRKADLAGCTVFDALV